MNKNLKMLALSSVVLLAACSTPKPGTPEAAAAQAKEERERAVKSVVKSVEEAPDWYTTPPVDNNTLYAAGTSQSSDMQMSLDSASLAAKRELAGQLNNRLSSKMKEFVNQVGGANDAVLNREIEIATQNVITEVNLSGFRREKSKVMPQGESYRAYVLLRYPLGDANKIVMDQVRKNSQLEAKVRASKAFQELEKEIEQAKKSQ